MTHYSQPVAGLTTVLTTAGHYSRTRYSRTRYSRTRCSRTHYSRTLQQDSTAGLTTLRIATPGGLPPANQQESLKKLHHRNLLTFRVKQNYGSGFVCRMSVKNNLEWVIIYAFVLHSRLSILILKHKTLCWSFFQLILCPNRQWLCSLNTTQAFSFCESIGFKTSQDCTVNTN